MQKKCPEQFSSRSRHLSIFYHNKVEDFIYDKLQSFNNYAAVTVTFPSAISK